MYGRHALPVHRSAMGRRQVARVGQSAIRLRRDAGFRCPTSRKIFCSSCPSASLAPLFSAVAGSSPRRTMAIVTGLAALLSASAEANPVVHAGSHVVPQDILANSLALAAPPSPRCAPPMDVHWPTRVRALTSDRAFPIPLWPRALLRCRVGTVRRHARRWDRRERCDISFGPLAVF